VGCERFAEVIGADEQRKAYSSSCIYRNPMMNTYAAARIVRLPDFIVLTLLTIASDGCAQPIPKAVGMAGLATAHAGLEVVRRFSKEDALKPVKDAGIQQVKKAAFKLAGPALIAFIVGMVVLGILVIGLVIFLCCFLKSRSAGTGSTSATQ